MGWRRFTICFDNHGKFQDKDACRAFFKFVKDFKPVERLHGGDCWDMTALRKGASEEERRESIMDDYSVGCEFLERLKPTGFTFGNHDARIDDWAASGNGVVGDLCLKWRQSLTELFEKMKCKTVPFGKRHFLPIGTTSHIFTHGSAHGIGAARQMASAYAAIGPVLFGHGHQIQHFSLPSIVPRFAAMGGCLCEIERTYNRSHLGTLAQENGWVYGEYRGNDLVWGQAKRIGNEFITLGF